MSGQRNERFIYPDIILDNDLLSDHVISKERLSFLLETCIVPTILESLSIEDLEVTNKFYQLKLYSILEIPETAMWHLSPWLLAQMYQDELETGDFEIPEEQS